MTGAGFRRTSEREVWRGARTGISIVTVEGPDGTTFERELVHHEDAVAVVPVLGSGEVLMVRQYRFAVDDLVLELPAGLCDVPGESLEDTARRELAEEVGCTAGHVERLASFHNAVGTTALRTTVFLATGLTEGAPDLQGPEEQAMTVERVALVEARRLVADGVVTDAKSVIGLLLAADRLGTAARAVT